MRGRMRFKSFVPAGLFLLLALIWTDASTLLRSLFAASGIAFLVEGIIKSVRGTSKGGSVDGGSADR